MDHSRIGNRPGVSALADAESPPPLTRRVPGTARSGPARALRPALTDAMLQQMQAAVDSERSGPPRSGPGQPGAGAATETKPDQQGASRAGSAHAQPESGHADPAAGDQPTPGREPRQAQPDGPNRPRQAQPGEPHRARASEHGASGLPRPRQRPDGPGQEAPAGARPAPESEPPDSEPPDSEPPDSEPPESKPPESKPPGPAQPDPPPASSALFAVGLTRSRWLPAWPPRQPGGRPRPAGRCGHSIASARGPARRPAGASSRRRQLPGGQCRAGEPRTIRNAPGRAEPGQAPSGQVCTGSLVCISSM